jgi:hypothetical protein
MLSTVIKESEKLVTEVKLVKPVEKQPTNMHSPRKEAHKILSPSNDVFCAAMLLLETRFGLQ